jgi:hypothetical protein
LAVILFSGGILVAAKALFIYYSTVFVISNQRVLNVVQKSFFNSTIVESEITDVHNMVSHKSGILRSLFNFGDLTIRISEAVADREMVIKNIPDPYGTEAVIAEEKNKARG